MSGCRAGIAALARLSHSWPLVRRRRAPVTPRDMEARKMSILAWIVLGLIAGIVAKALVPGRDPGGCMITIVIGIVGALLGGWLSTLLGFGGLAGGLDLRNLVIASLGAIVLLVLWRLLTGRRV
jgi:uncharacterized membrane protein YeaQ/YmgE (transglycosylase-associated protein family)